MDGYKSLNTYISLSIYTNILYQKKKVFAQILVHNLLLMTLSLLLNVEYYFKLYSLILYFSALIISKYHFFDTLNN
jgi:hypothetical protein